MDTKNQSGFTLIELLIALAVAAVLLGIGIPSFSGAIKNSQVAADYAELRQALFLARSESVKSTSRVTVCPKIALDAENCGANADDWQYGWLVFVDNTREPGETVATIDPDDEIISISAEPRADANITAWGSDDRTSAGSGIRKFIRYGKTGQAEWTNGSFHICNKDLDPEYSRSLNVAPTGDVRPGRPSGSDYPRDVFGNEVCK